MSYRKVRGHDDSSGTTDLTLEERRRQWNINLANRTLENMFEDINLDEIEICPNRGYMRRKITPQILYDRANAYFQNIVETNESGIAIIPDIEDFCVFAHITRDIFLSFRRSDNPEMREVAESIANAIANCKKQSALQGTLNPTIFAIDMNNNHNYVQAKTELTVNQNLSVQQIEANIEDIANRLPMDD